MTDSLKPATPTYRIYADGLPFAVPFPSLARACAVRYQFALCWPGATYTIRKVEDR